MPISTRITPKSTSPAGEGFTKALLEPGNFKVKINSIYLQHERNIKFGSRLMLNLETEPVGGNFKGLNIIKDNPEKDTYLGRTGKVSYSQYSFRDWLSPQGMQVEKEIELQVAIHDLCKELGIFDWYLAQDDKQHYDMEAFIEAMDVDKPFKDIYFYVCIGGKEYLGQGKYLNHEMYFVRSSRTRGLSFSLKEEKVIKFFSSEDVIKLSVGSEPSISTETSSEQPKTTFEPNKPVNIAEAETNPQVLAFLNDSPLKKEPITSPFTNEILNDMKDQKQELTKDQDIIAANGENPYMPWDLPQYDEWEKANKK